MSDNDLIRRGEAIAMLSNLPIYFEYVSDAENLRAEHMIQMAQRRLSALPAAQDTVGAELTEARRLTHCLSPRDCNDPVKGADEIEKGEKE